MSGWDGFDREDLVDNMDYWNEVRWGGDPRSDEEIKAEAHGELDDDFIPDEYDEEEVIDWQMSSQPRSGA
jgi:hypothetical protein